METRGWMFDVFLFLFFSHSLYLVSITIKILSICLSYIDFHNILILFDVLPNYLSTTKETMRDYYL